MMLPDFDHTHQSALGVVQDVAVEHPHPFGAGPVVISDDDAQGLLVRHIDGVLPGNRPDRLAFVVENMEEESMQMERCGAIRTGVKSGGRSASARVNKSCGPSYPLP